MNEAKFWLTFCGIVAVTVVLLAAIISFSICYSTKDMVENGYEEVTIQGYQGTVWQKIRGHGSWHLESKGDAIKRTVELWNARVKEVAE